LKRASAACYRALGGTGLLGPPPMSHPIPIRGLPDPQEARMSQEAVTPVVHSDEYRQLEAQHHQYESRLGELADKAVLSDEEQLEEITLKKKKLQLKDKMQEIARRFRGLPAQP